MASSPAPGDATATDPVSTAEPARGEAGKFTTGSTMRHVLVMTAAGSVGLMSIFIVDLLNLFYISLLGQQELAAAIGYAGTVLFFLTSVGIGLSIGTTALVSRALGARDKEAARRLAGSGALFSVIAMGALALGLMAGTSSILGLLGATGTTRALAERFLLMTLPSAVFLGLGMITAGILRAVGDAGRAMWVTLGAGLVAAVADPILIFGLGLGLDGAAWATNLSRLAMAAIGLHGVMGRHGLLGWPTPVAFARDLAALSVISVPAVLTNIATPVGNAYVTAALATHGDAAVAAWAVIGRLVPVAFGAVFALSGAIGPILGQNYGARLIPRVRRTLIEALILTSAYVLTVWACLFLLQEPIIRLFAASGEAADLIRFYSSVVAGTFLFMGWLFVANAAFNTLGAPLWATVFNWGRATLGTIPFAAYGGAWYGAQGVLLGQGLGGVIFGIGAALVAFRVVERLPRAPQESQ